MTSKFFDEPSKGNFLLIIILVCIAPCLRQHRAGTDEMFSALLWGMSVLSC